MGNGVSFNQVHLKANLQMGISRLSLMRNKRINQISLLKDEIAGLLHNGKEEMAMVKVESIINHENFITSIEVLNMFCTQLIERVFQIASSTTCPPDIQIAVETLIWASTRIDCQELLEVRLQFAAKFGENFCRAAVDNREGYVNSIVREKLVNIVPSEEMKVVKIQEIASEKRIDFVFKHQIRKDMQNSLRPNLAEPNGFPPAQEFPPAQNFPPQVFPNPEEKREEPERNFDLPQNLPKPGYQDFDIGSLEDRFKKLK